MILNGVLPLIHAHPAYQALHTQLSDTVPIAQHFDVIRAARPVLAAALVASWNGPVIYITSRVKRSYDVAEQLPVWLSAETPIYRFAEPVPAFYEHAPWGDNVIPARLEALFALVDDSGGASHPVIVTSVKALVQRTLPFNRFRRETLTLTPGERISIDRLLTHLVGIGYESSPVVIQPGTFSRRGGVVDVYPMNLVQPVRIDFFDDEIDSLRHFDPSTQRSQDAVQRLRIIPAREALPMEGPPLSKHLAAWFGSLPDESDIHRDLPLLSSGGAFTHLEFYLPYMLRGSATLLDYALDNALVIVDDPDDLQTALAEIDAHAQDIRASGHATQRLPDDYPAPYLSAEMLNEALTDRRLLALTSGGAVTGGLFSPEGRFGGQLKTALNHISGLEKRGDRAVVISEQVARVSDLWAERSGADYVPISYDFNAMPPAGVPRFISGSLSEGWMLNSVPKLHLITDAELFGWNRPEPRRRPGRRPVRLPEAEYADWREGDFVVHIDYGVGRFVGMKHRILSGIEREYLVVRYADNDQVFVPIHQADRLTRYIGTDDKPPTLHKLGKPDWERIRSRTRKAVEENAKELLALYAQRANAQGHAFRADDHWQHELEASFPFVETQDQLRAVAEVKADMEKSIPMDRLICGDVGYGKTEVALRAAFKAVNEGKQVAVLVPTTILAQQHYETFSSRLREFPVKIALMSRFRSKEEQSRILPKIASGEIDIVIGTHRILSADITLRDLGLVIIDEEQRFGVKQKEHFKSLRTQVDVLTLTATPIPRTLHMSLTGVRDISMIQTPPEERLPVITQVSPFDESLVRQAVLRELERGGQVFIVHNRIRTIHTLHDALEEIVPEARIITGHGQMNERQLEGVMSSFARGEFDVLLSTAIIESGIDIPNANTLIVDRADWFGLAQLYQLRGRVGRSARQAYAFFFYHADGKLTGEARARLDTLKENSSLGAGLQIAMRDLEIRGTGDILSTRQTGHVAAVGLNLYTQMLSDAVDKLKRHMTPTGPDAGTTSRVRKPTPLSSSSIVLNLPLPAYIPDDWVEELALRLQIYRRIGSLTQPEEVHAMRDELLDRFGRLPQAVDGLLYQMEAKLLAQHAAATAVIVNATNVQIKLPYLAEINRDALADAIGSDARVTRTAVEVPRDNAWRERLLKLLAQLSQVAAAPQSG